MLFRSALCDGTYVLAYEFAALEEEQCREVAYAVLCCYVVDTPAASIPPEATALP